MAQKVARKKYVKKKRDNTTLLIVGGIIAVVVVVLAILVSVNYETRPAATTAAEASGKTWGKASAPVTIDEWSDFQ